MSNKFPGNITLIKISLIAFFNQTDFWQNKTDVWLCLKVFICWLNIVAVYNFVILMPLNRVSSQIEG